MKHLSAIAITLLLLTSCGNSLIPRGKLSRIVADIYLSDKFVNNTAEMVSKADSTMLYEPILNSYGYTSDDFIRTIEYYVERPAKLKTVYLKAQESLQLELDNINIQLLHERRVDSLRVSLSQELAESNINKTEPDSRSRSLRWIIFSEIDEIHYIKTPLVNAIDYDSPVSGFWWRRSLEQNQKPFYKYEKDRRTIPLPRKLEPGRERVLEVG